MAKGAYGEDLGQRVGAEKLASLGLDLFPQSNIAITRVSWKARREELYASLPQDDAFIVCLQLREIPEHPYWVDGKFTDIPPIKAGRFSLLDLRLSHASELSCALDCMNAYIPAAALKSFAYEYEVAPGMELCIPPAQSIDDPVVRGLLSALLPALEKPQEANRLFLDHVALALIAHMTSTYGDAAPGKRIVTRGGLAAWQERRAKEAMLASMSSNMSLADLAALCGLSRSHFARAFRQSTGLPPHRWLLARRVEQAQSLLLHSTMSLEKIATSCGFADQSHFSRVFSRQIGISPGVWRRLRRL